MTLPHLRIAEFFSGLGGLHASLVDSVGPSMTYEVVAAFDINTTANALYSRNFHLKVNDLSIETIECKDLESLNADIWLLSPPCQPYTRQGLKKDTEDPRAKGLLHLLELLTKMDNIPKYILLENVVGFENSNSRNELIDVIQNRGYHYQEFHLSPDQFGIPNSRLRYFFIGRLHGSFDHQGSVITSIPNNPFFVNPKEPYPLKSVLEENVVDYFVPESVLSKDSAMCFDLVYPTSTRSCCFTKAYSRFIMGTGSVLQTADESIKADNSDVNSLKNLKLRYFTPREMMRIHGFPDTYDITGVSKKKMYQLIGNSLNVCVVSQLVKYMLKP